MTFLDEGCQVKVVKVEVNVSGPGNLTPRLLSTRKDDDDTAAGKTKPNAFSLLFSLAPFWMNRTEMKQSRKSYSKHLNTVWC